MNQLKDLLPPLIGLPTDNGNGLLEVGFDAEGYLVIRISSTSEMAFSVVTVKLDKDSTLLFTDVIADIAKSKKLASVPHSTNKKATNSPG